MNQTAPSSNVDVSARSEIGLAAVSIALIVVLPMAFWLLVLEWLLPALGVDYGIHLRLAVALAIGGLLLLIWAIIWNSGGRGDCARRDY